MARILPFRGITYDLGKIGGRIEDLVAPPYDCISEGEKRELKAKSPYNVIRLTLPRGYEDASNTFMRWLEDGILKEDSSPGFYIYGIEYDIDGRRKESIGFICLMDLEYNHILPHEETFAEPVWDRLSLISASMANFEVIVGLYEDLEGDLGKVLEEGRPSSPFLETKWKDRSVHRIWKVDDPGILKDLIILMEGKEVLIADGHHRYEASLALKRKMARPGPWDYTMILLFRTGDLSILPFHRLIKGVLGGIEGTLARLSSRFDLEIGDEFVLKGMGETGEWHTFGLYLGKGRYGLLKVRRGLYSDPVKALDVSVLHETVMEWMGDVDGIDYTHDTEKAISLVDSGDYDLVFILRPVSLEEIWDVARARRRMPQKVTYFFPKPLSGLVMRRIEED